MVFMVLTALAITAIYYEITILGLPQPVNKAILEAHLCGLLVGMEY